MIVFMIVTLYTTRVVLDELGVDDYGIYSIVGSVAVSLIFIQNALNTATQRYLSYEIGKTGNNNIVNVFSMAKIFHIILAVFTILFLETVGMWFVNNVLNIPENRIYSANVAYQFSVFTFVVNLLRVPYNALIIAYEKMNLYALFSVFEALIRLGGVFLLYTSFYDKLELYSFIVLITSVIVNIIYVITCNRSFEETVSKKSHFDKSLFKNMSSFLGWNMYSGLVGMGVNEGPGYFINVYLGVTANAGLGIAKQVSSAIYSFSSNFQHAFNPQIVKTYASKNTHELIDLVESTSIMSYYLMFIIALPFILCCDIVFELWLGTIPPYAIQFSAFLVLAELVSALGAPLWMTAHAIGNIKRYQLFVSSISLLIIPISWLSLKLNLEPFYIYVFLILVNIGIYSFRVLYLQQKINFPAKEYVFVVLKRCIIPSLFCIPIPLIVALHIHNFLGVIFVSFISVINTGLIFLFFVLSLPQRNTILNYIYTRFRSYY